MHETLTPITAKEIAKREKVDIATIRLRWNANFGKGTFDSNRELSPEQVEILSRSKRAGKEVKPREAKSIIRTPAPISVNQPAPAINEAMPPAPGRAKFEWPTFADLRRWIFNGLAIAIVCGHGYMIWQEAAEFYGYLGNIGGAIVFAIVCLSVLVASDSSRSRTSGSALVFMAFVDLAAIFVHYEALQTPGVPKAMTIGFCIFICACSFVALLLYRDSKLD